MAKRKIEYSEPEDFFPKAIRDKVYGNSTKKTTKKTTTKKTTKK